MLRVVQKCRSKSVATPFENVPLGRVFCFGFVFTLSRKTTHNWKKERIESLTLNEKNKMMKLLAAALVLLTGLSCFAVGEEEEKFGVDRSFPMHHHCVEPSHTRTQGHLRGLYARMS